MRWIVEHTPAETRFVVLTGPGNRWYADLISEVIYENPHAVIFRKR